MRRFFSTLTFIATILLGSTLIQGDQIQPLLDIGEERQKSEKVSQTWICVKMSEESISEVGFVFYDSKMYTTLV